LIQNVLIPNLKIKILFIPDIQVGKFPFFEIQNFKKENLVFAQ